MSECEKRRREQKTTMTPVPVSSIKALVYNFSLKNETTFNLRVKMLKDLYHTRKYCIYLVSY